MRRNIKMSQITYLTPQGLTKLKKELDRLVNIERPAISKLIGEAIEKGDISENAEYDAAKDAQGMLEAKIAELQSKIANSRILDKSRINTSKVQILNKVKIKNKKNNAVMEYYIVPESEANLKEGKIAVNTPIAKGLMGKKVGDVVEISVPSGVIAFEIIEISL
jgi:transcription elongation factor GreA